MLLGVPVITSDWEVFPETNLHGITGYRCRTMEQFAWAARNIDRIDGHVAAKWARDNFAMERVVLQYEEFFDQCLRVRDMNGPVDGPTGFYGLNPERTELDSLRRYYPGFEYSSAPPTSVDPFPKPTPVISFVVRAHNEEASLRQSITSLFPDRATYRGRRHPPPVHGRRQRNRPRVPGGGAGATPREDRKVRGARLPRGAGDAVPEGSRHSIMSYYDWAFSQASAAWRFKWDAGSLPHRVSSRGSTGATGRSRTLAR